MKKFILAIMAMVLTAPAFAQMASGGFSLSHSTVYYGVRIGASFSNLDVNVGGQGVDLGTKTGMTLAGVIGLRVSESVPVFLESGLYYNGRGAKKDEAKLNLNYFDIPILIKYGVNVKDQITILPFVGPYFGYAIGGKATIGDIDGNPFRDGMVKHGDMGFKFGAGVEYNMLYLEAGYQAGVANIGKKPNETHTGSFFMNFGINF